MTAARQARLPCSGHFAVSYKAYAFCFLKRFPGIKGLYRCTDKARSNFVHHEPMLLAMVLTGQFASLSFAGINRMTMPYQGCAETVIPAISRTLFINPQCRVSAITANG